MSLNDYLKMEKYDSHTSEHLCKHYNQEFDKWWNADKFDWTGLNLLLYYCYKHIDKWFLPKYLKPVDYIQILYSVIYELDSAQISYIEPKIIANFNYFIRNLTFKNLNDFYYQKLADHSLQLFLDLTVPIISYLILLTPHLNKKQQKRVLKLTLSILIPHESRKQFLKLITDPAMVNELLLETF